jgi:hypothetical protein
MRPPALLIIMSAKTVLLCEALASVSVADEDFSERALHVVCLKLSRGAYQASPDYNGGSIGLVNLPMHLQVQDVVWRASCCRLTPSFWLAHVGGEDGRMPALEPQRLLFRVRGHFPFLPSNLNALTPWEKSELHQDDYVYEQF